MSESTNAYVTVVNPSEKEEIVLGAAENVAAQPEEAVEAVDAEMPEDTHDAVETMESDTIESDGEINEEKAARSRWPKSAERKVKKLSRRNREYQQRLADLEAQIASMQQGVYNQQPVELQKPSRHDFDDPAEYAEALLTHMEQRESYTKAQQEQQRYMNEQQALERQQRALLHQFAEQEEDARDRYHDYDDVVEKLAHDPEGAISVVMRDTLIQESNGTDVAYWLGQNIGEARRIANLPPYRQASEIGKIASNLSKPRRVKSKAAPPLSSTPNQAPVSGGYDMRTAERIAQQGAGAMRQWLAEQDKRRR